jgi:hypothetical protein
MSYGADVTGRIAPDRRLCRSHSEGGEAGGPAVVQSTKIEFVINHQTARTLGIRVPDSLLAGPMR